MMSSSAAPSTSSPQQQPILSRLKSYISSIGIYTKFLLVTCLIIFLIQLFSDDVTIYLSYNAYLIIEEWQVWRLVTFAFLHGGFLHIFFNMMALLSLGSMLEKRQGTFHFILSSWICLLLSSVMHTLFLFIMFRGFGWLLNWYITPGVGYSGVLFAYVVLSIRYYPEARNLCGFSVAPHLMPWILLIVAQVLMWNVSFLGHVTGIFAGYIYFFLLKWPAYRKVVFKMESVFVPSILRRLDSFKDMETDGIDSVDQSNNRFSQQSNSGVGLRSILGQWRTRFSNWRQSRAAASQRQRTESDSSDSAPATRSYDNQQYSHLNEDLSDEEMRSMEEGRPTQSTSQQQPKTFPGEGKRLGS